MTRKHHSRRRTSAVAALALSLAVVGGGLTPLLEAAPSHASLDGMCEPDTFYTLDRSSGADATELSIKKATFGADGTINPALTPIDADQPLSVSGLGSTQKNTYDGSTGGAVPSTHYLNALGTAQNGDVWFIDQRGVYGQAGVTEPVVDVYHYSDPHDGFPKLHLAYPAMSLNSPVAGYVVGGAVDQLSGHYYFAYFSQAPLENGGSDPEKRRFHLYRAVSSTDGAMEPSAGEVAHVDFPVPAALSNVANDLNGDFAFDADGNLQAVVTDSEGDSVRVQLNRAEFEGLAGRQSGRPGDGVRGDESDPLKVPTIQVPEHLTLVSPVLVPRVNGVAFTEGGAMITQAGNRNVMRDSVTFAPTGSLVDMTGVDGDLVDLASCAAPDIALPDPGFELTKHSDPASGVSVQPGATIAYTVTGINTGDTALDPVVISDDLSRVFAFAEYQNDLRTVVANLDGTPVPGAPDAVIGSESLGWTGVLQVGQQVTITYSVIVNEGVEGETLENRVTGSGTPPGSPGEPPSPIEPPAVTTHHPVPGFEISKEADPASGTEVDPGETITYTLTGTNIGATLLDPAILTDDLSGVVVHAHVNDDALAEIDGTPVVAPTRTGDTLAWAGALRPGETVTVTYSVTVHPDAANVSLHNLLTGAATPQVPDPGNPTGPPIPGEPLVPPEEETEHPLTSRTPADPGAGPSGGSPAKPLASTGDPLVPFLGALGGALLLAGATLLGVRRFTRV